MAFALILGGTSVFAVTRVAGSRPAEASAALNRWLDPFGPHAWPPRTRIVLEAPELVALGSTSGVSIVASGELPDDASVEIRGEGISRVLAVPLEGGRARFAFSAAGLPHMVTITARAGDGVSEPVRVRVRPAPALVGPPHIRVTPPAYTLLTPFSPEPIGPTALPRGGRVTLHARFDRPVDSVILETVDSGRPADRPEWMLFGGSPALPRAVCAAWDRPVELAVERREASAEWTPLRSGNYALRWRDADGLTGEIRLDLKLIDDPAPATSLAFADSPPVGGGLPLSGVLRLRAAAEDPRYGLKSARLELELAGRPRRSEDLPPPAGALACLLGGPGVLVREPVHAAAWRVERPLAGWRLSDGSALRPADRVRVRVVADDDSPEPFREGGASDWLEFRVLADGEWRAAFRARTADLARELLQAAGVQDQARADLVAGSDAAEPSARRDAAFRAEQWQTALRAKNLGPQSPAQKIFDELLAPGAPPGSRSLARLREELAGLDAENLKPTESQLRQWSRPANTLDSVEAKALARRMAESAEALRRWAAGLDAEPESAKLPGDGWKLLDDWRGQPLTEAGPDRLGERTLDWLERLRQRRAEAATRRDELRGELDRLPDDADPARVRELRDGIGRAGDEFARLDRALKGNTPEAADRLAKQISEADPDRIAVTEELAGVVERLSALAEGITRDPIAEAKETFDVLRKKKKPSAADIEIARNQLLGHAEAIAPESPKAAEAIRKAANALPQNPEAVLEELTRRRDAAPSVPPDELPRWVAEQEKIVSALAGEIKRLSARPLDRASLLHLDSAATAERELSLTVERAVGPGRAVVRDLAERMATCYGRAVVLFRSEANRFDDVARADPPPADAPGWKAAHDEAAAILASLRRLGENAVAQNGNRLDRPETGDPASPPNLPRVDPWAARYLLERQTQLAARTAEWRAKFGGENPPSEASNRLLAELQREQANIASLLRRIAGGERP